MAVTALSIERGAFYILKTAPLSAGRLLRAKMLGIFVPYAALATIGLLAAVILLGVSPVWTPFGWLVLLVMGYGVYSYTVALGFLYPNLSWEDPSRMSNRKAILPGLVGSVGYSLVAIVVAVFTYFVAQSDPTLTIPIVVLGLGLLAGGTYLFVSWCTRRVEAAWPRIGAT
jgi:hypothetical protein